MEEEKEDTEDPEDGWDGRGFDSLSEKMKNDLMDRWIEVLCGPLGIEGPDAEMTKAGLKQRFIFTNNGLSPKMLKKLRNEFEVEVEDGIEDIYVRSVASKTNPFPLRGR
jgi:hypothetical protein